VNRARVYALIDAERDQQSLKWDGPHDWGHGDCSSDGVDPITKVAVLAEECGEVARAVLDAGLRPEAIDNLRRELVQVAAVAVAWLESM
jgi:NTP pyrophosphatase (non-canonical NTP hydrolase)